MKTLVSLKVKVALCDLLNNHYFKNYVCIAPFIVRIILAVIFLDVNVLAQTSRNIKTYPVLPERKLATNFSGLQLSTYTSRYSRSGSRCQWEFGNRSPIVLLDRGYYNANCRNTTGSYYISNCVERNGGVSATLIITEPIEASIFVRLRCRSQSYNSYSQVAWINIAVAGWFFMCRLIAHESRQVPRTSFHIF